MDDADVCVICGKIATSFTCSAPDDVLAYCVEHLPPTTFNRERLEATLNAHFGGIKSEKKRKVQRLRCEFIVSGAHAHIDRIQQRLNANGEIHVNPMQIPNLTSKIEMVRCLTAWFEPKKVQEIGRFSSALIDECTLHQCQCVGCGVEVEWMGCSGPSVQTPILVPRGCINFR